MLGQERLDAVGAEPTPVHVGEQCARPASRRFLEPRLKGDPRVRSQRRATFLSPLADTSHMRAGAEMDGVPVQTDQLGETQACLGGEQQQGVIPASEPGCPIGRSEDRLDLGASQEMHLTLVVTLVRYREDALNDGTMGRLLEGCEAEEGADGG